MLKEKSKMNRGPPVPESDRGASEKRLKGGRQREGRKTNGM